MNKHILLVMKWLKDPESVSHEELKANHKAVDTADVTTIDAYAATYAAVTYAGNAIAAVNHSRDCTEYWVNKYFKLTGENREDYIKELTGENKHILLVMKWLDNPESVTQEELKANYKAASADFFTAHAADITVTDILAAAALAAGATTAAGAKYWVNRYFELTGENRKDYENALAEKCVGHYLPPVGTECLYKWNEYPYLKCKILGYHNNLVWLHIELTTPYNTITLKSIDVIFKPLKSEKEKLIDEMISDLGELKGNVVDGKEVLNRLFEAGYRKISPTDIKHKG